MKRSAEEASKDAYREKINILESIGDGFFAVDRSSVVTYWNTMAERYLQVRRQNIVGRCFWEVFPDSIGLPFHTKYEKAMKEQVTVHCEEYYPALDIWVDVNMYPSPTGLAVYFRDITEQKSRTRKIEDQNEQLREIAHIQSHQVRAPLARIVALVSLLKDGGDGEIELDVLASLENSAAELDGLVRKIVCKAEGLKSNE